MDWLLVGLWFLAILVTLSIIGTVFLVEKPRDPISPGEAAARITLGLIELAILVAAVIRINA